MIGDASGDPAPTRRLPVLAWDAPLYCHAPVDEPFDPTALTTPGDGSDRWSGTGQPTAYLAGDPGVVLGELARHQPAGGAVGRRIMRLDTRPGGIGGLVDLRDPAVLRELGLPAGVSSFLDADRARALADRLREDGRHRGLIVPSMAFLDQPTRVNLVLYGERLGDGGVEAVLAGWREIGRVGVEP